MQLKLKTLTISLLALGLSASIFAKPVLVKKYDQIEEYQLDNGLKVILSDKTKNNTVFMNVIYQAGSLNDPLGKSGMAHLLEHLAFKGTENIKEGNFQSALDQYTLFSNARTDYYSTQYMSEIRSEQNTINKVIELEAERMDKLVLDKKFVAPEIEVVKREREANFDQTFSRLMNKIFQSIYGVEYFGREPIGELTELESINMSELNQFYRTWYRPNNAVIVLTGNFDKTAVLNQINQKFGGIPSKIVPEQPTIPKISIEQAKSEDIVIKKGDGYQKINVYIVPRNEEIEPTLDITSALFTLEPSGTLYQRLVEKGIVDNVDVALWTSRDFNMMFVSADYVPSQNLKKMNKALIENVEKKQKFNQADVKRLQDITKNSRIATFREASALGGMLSEAIVLNRSDWLSYFNNRDRIQSLTTDQVSQDLQKIFKEEYRLEAEIQPTPLADQEKQRLEPEQAPQFLQSMGDTKQETPKNLAVYKKETEQYVKQAQTILEKAETKIQRGTLETGPKYALYSTPTKDDQISATLTIPFSTAKKLMNHEKIIDISTYLMSRGSDQYPFQYLMDKSIEVNGGVAISSNLNSIDVQVVANKDKFEEYFKLIIDILQKPSFEQKQFDSIKSKYLNQMDRTYTEPDIVVAMALSEIANPYPQGDLRAYSDPEFTVKLLKQVTNKQVKKFYEENIGLDFARVAVTGEFDASQMKEFLNSTLSKWKTKTQFEEMEFASQPKPAQKHYLKSEPREFGSYSSIMNIEMGSDSPDLPAVLVMGYILGESQLTSRLAKELRENKNLVYGFSQSLDLNEGNNASSFSISANYTAGKADLVS